MKKILFLVSSVIIISCNKGGVSEKRVVEIVDSIMVSKNLTQSNKTNPNNNSIIDSFIGEWNDNNTYISIGNDKSFSMGNSVCSSEFTYKESGSELILVFEDLACKIQKQDGNNRGLEVGKCYIQNGELIVEFKYISELEGTGISAGNYKRGSRY
jgi:hypothetical protein